MPSPFPGMDPYLEDAELWSDFHAEMISAIRVQLAPLLQPRYLAYIGERVYVMYERESALRRVRPDVAIESAPDEPGPTGVVGTAGAAVAEPVPAVAVLEDRQTEPRIEIRYARTHHLVTAIEVLSPSNKDPARDTRADYLLKRGQIHRRDSHLVEIDLLRAGDWMPFEPVRSLPPHAYLALVDRAANRPHCAVYPISLQQSLPTIPIPLAAPDPDVALDLQVAFTTAFERGPYVYKIDYQRALSPPLPTDLADWASHVVRKAGSQ